LEGLGAVIALPPDGVAASLRRAAIGFMFAQAYHPAMKHVALVRRELGIRTVFNILGPLTNPAGVTRQVIGVSDPTVARLMAAALANLGTERALIVSSSDGMDELSLAGPNQIIEYDAAHGGIREYTLDAADLGLRRAGVADVAGGDPRENVRITRAVLAGDEGAHRDVVLLNAAAALYAAGVVDTVADGIHLAAESIDSGRAAGAVEAFVSATRALA
jgi:anthranilate phosphoribosyltransferase